MGQKDANAKQTQDHNDRFNHLTHPYLHYGVRSIALAGFKIASLILRNGFVPSGEASHAVAGITRRLTPTPSRTHQRAFLESGRAMRVGSGPLSRARRRETGGLSLSRAEAAAAPQDRRREGV